MPTVLVIDDDASTRDAIAALLRRKQYNVVVACDAPAGLELAAAVDFDVVLVDMFMPEMDGIATMRAMARIAPKVPMVAMSGYAFTSSGDADFLGRVMRLGAKATLQKPFRANELFAAIDCCLEAAVATASASAVQQAAPCAGRTAS